MRAVDMYRKFKNRKCSDELLKRLEQILPYKRYNTIKKNSDRMNGVEATWLVQNEASKWKSTSHKEG